MVQTLIFPKLGQTMEEGAIVKWLKQEGDQVAKGDLVFEIETDKANLEVESFFAGTLLKIVVPEGVTVPVNAVVGYIGEAGETVPEAPVATAKPAAKPAAAAPGPADAGRLRPPPGGERPRAAGASHAASAESRPSPAPPAAPPGAAAAEGGSVAERLVISPRARALARDCAIDPARLRGSGPHGRIVERDVRAYLEEKGYGRLRISPAAKELARAQAVDILTVRGTGDAGRIMVADIERAMRRKPRPLSRIRQIIARRLVESKQSIPHFYVTVAADLTALLRLRAELKERGVVYSVNDFILEAVALSLEEYPAVNSVTDGRTISWRGDVDLGVAVSVEAGLVVPVVRAAQLLTLAELRDRVRALVDKARRGKLTPDEMSGGGFTVSNMGMLDVENFSAIINPGEAAILAVASSRPRAVVVDGAVCVRDIMKMTLSCDHRIVDGALGAAFANAIRAKLEDAALWRRLA